MKYEEKLLKEYKNFLIEENDIKNELSDLPKGYIRKKTIGRKEYSYLQCRDKETVKSCFIKDSDIVTVEKGLKERKRKERYIKELEHNRKMIEKAFGRVEFNCKYIKFFTIDLLRDYDVKKFTLFGSRAKGTYGANSDFDFLVEFKNDASLMDLAGLREELKDRLMMEVDLIMWPIKEETFMKIEKEKVIYEA